jgi:hypothetical protein
LWRPHGPEADEARASFGLAAAKAIEKLGIRPSAVPTPTEYFPQWRLYCSSEEEFARKAGKEIDLSESVPFGLGEEDRDAIDPCSRAWLELLRRNELGFKITAHGTDTIKGQKFDSLEGTIERVCSVSSLYCKRLARNEIKERLLKDLARPTDQPGTPFEQARPPVIETSPSAGEPPLQTGPGLKEPACAQGDSGPESAELKGEKLPILNVEMIKAWIEGEGWINETLAQKLQISERAVSSMRNNGNYHGADAVTKLANLMGRDPGDLYLPSEAST